MTRSQYQKLLAHLTLLGCYIDRQKESPDRDKADNDLTAVLGLVHSIESELYPNSSYKDWHSDENDFADSD